MKKNIVILLILIALVFLFFSGCVQEKGDGAVVPTPVEDEGKLKIEPVDLTGIKEKELSFIQYYSLEPLEIDLKVAQYELPLGTEQIYNFADFSSKISLSGTASGFVEKNGFAVIEDPYGLQGEDIIEPYNLLKAKEIPIFITTDSLLHLYHIQFDETLRQIEEKEFYDRIWEISKTLLTDSIAKYENADGDLKEAAKRNTAYFSVGLSLLKPTEEQLCQSEYEEKCTDAFFKKEDLGKYAFELPDFVEEEVEEELGLVKAHGGFSVSPIFKYNEDYSQYVPRGHYTRSEKLKNYFKAVMWYGRISFLLKKDLIQSDAPEKDAKIQTIGASMVAAKLAEDEETRKKWDKIYAVTAFYVGLSDDLGPYEYAEALNAVFAGTFDANEFDEEKIDELKKELAKFQPPKIYGGTGACTIVPPFTLEQAEECMEATKGMRLMGQRFIPDSYMFSNLVGNYTDFYTGENCSDTFTCVSSDAGLIRGFPRGLDVAALLGSKRAKELLQELGDDDYKKYEEQFNKLKEEFDAFGVEEWNKNLYWSWLYSLKSLVKEFEAGYPTFMQNQAWVDKELTTSLASWAQLRHDTILYAKQSYTMVAITAMPDPPIPEKPVVGYVEPVPEFYNRLLALTRMTNKGLNEMEVLDETAKYRLEKLEEILERLVAISEKELANEELTQEDYDFIENFGDELNAVISEVEEKAKKTTIIADVHTDINTKTVLEEGTGYVKLIVVAYKVPDGRILIGAGPVLSYYEFKQPMQNRLTDEAWREMLKSEPPKEPEWVKNFAE